MNELQSIADRLLGRHGLRGAALRLAALIALSWLAAGVALALVGSAWDRAATDFSGSEMARQLTELGRLLAAGSAAAAVTFPIVASQLAPWAARSRGIWGPVVTIAVVQVIATAAAVAPLFGLVGLFAGPAGIALFALLAFVIGLLIFGLPGLAVALPSSYLVVRLLRTAAARREAVP
jgi:hypothetical protein